MARSRTTSSNTASSNTAPTPENPAPDAPDGVSAEDGPALPDGVRLGDVEQVVAGGYPERSYDEALTDEHREALERFDQLP